MVNIYREKESTKNKKIIINSAFFIFPCPNLVLAHITHNATGLDSLNCADSGVLH